MTTFEQVELPNPLHYVEWLLHEDKFDEAAMHLIDVLSRAQEDDNKVLSAWYSFYMAVISARISVESVPAHIVSALQSRLGTEEEDAKIVFHSLCVLSHHVSQLHEHSRGEKVLPTNKPRSSGSGQLPQSSALAALAVGNTQPQDRIWNLIKSRPSENGFVLNGLAKRVLNVYYPFEEAMALMNKLDMHTSIMLELGKRYSLGFVSFENTIASECPMDTENGAAASNALPEDVDPNSVQYKVGLLIAQTDCVLYGNKWGGLPPPIVYSGIHQGLQLAVKHDMKISTKRLLIRYADCLICERRIPQALLLLDDIECGVVSDCISEDISLFFQARSNGLRRLAELLGESSSDKSAVISAILADAMKAEQIAISRSDRRNSLPPPDQLVMSPQGGRGMQTLIAWKSGLDFD